MVDVSLTAVIGGILNNALAAASAATMACTAEFISSVLMGGIDPDIPSGLLTICAVRKKKYECTAKCQTNGAPGGADYVTATSNRNCSLATQAAKARVPRGQYPRHCNCKDTEGFIGNGHQCEAHVR